jgi:hypothetical protein
LTVLDSRADVLGPAPVEIASSWRVSGSRIAAMCNADRSSRQVWRGVDADDLAK